MKDYRQPEYLRTLPKRFAAYTLYRERDFTEPSWVRPADLKGVELKRPVVLLNGAFDLLHSTHMRMIFAARHKAATLVLALDSDDRISKAKGPERPILNFIERLTALSYMPVDYCVEITSEQDMQSLIAAVKPDLRCQGEDYIHKPTRFPEVRKLIVREGKLRTSEIIERILTRHAQN